MTDNHTRPDDEQHDLLDFIAYEDGGRLGAPDPVPEATTCPHCETTEPSSALLASNHAPDSYRARVDQECVAMHLTRNHVLGAARRHHPVELYTATTAAREVWPPARAGWIEDHVDDADRQRRAAGLRCLRDAVPTALEAVIHLTYWRPRDERKPSAGDDWAYCVSRAGIRFEDRQQWSSPADPTARRGWDRTPAQLLTWRELAALVGHDPRRAAVATWASSCTHPDAWRDLQRPFQLWTRPDRWHPSYTVGDHERQGWPNRLAAWTTTLDILTTAHDTLLNHPTAGRSAFPETAAVDLRRSHNSQATDGHPTHSRSATVSAAPAGTGR